MSELGTMRPRVLAALQRLHAIPVENITACPGTPDVNYVEGWLELKWLREWPARPHTVVSIEHFTGQQRVWHTRRARVGGSSYLLLEVRCEWLLFTGKVAAEHVGKVTRAELYRLCVGYWPVGLVNEELRTILCERRTERS